MLFNELGRNIPSENCRVFSTIPKNFYKIDTFNINYAKQHKLACSHKLISNQLDISQIESYLLNIKNLLHSNDEYQNLFNGTAIPFCLSTPNLDNDLGTTLEEDWLPLLKKEYEKKVQGTNFKATLQGNTELKKSVKISTTSGYDIFIDNCKKSTVIGYFFPTAFQEFDIKSQRLRITELPKISNLNICLSGPFEIIYSLICYPKLLFSKQNYCPILCASALEHVDPRMVMLFKSYGPHLEFWLMTQMLTPTKTQVSEQWSGGMTIFKTLK